MPLRSRVSLSIAPVNGWAGHDDPQLLGSLPPWSGSADALGAVAAEAVRSTQADGAAIAWNADGVFVCKAASGDVAPAVGTTVDTDSGLSGLCVRTGLALVCNDAETDQRVSKEACRNLGIRSIVVVPVGESPVTGLLEVFSREPFVFDSNCVDSLVKLAQSIALVLNPGGQSEKERDALAVSDPPIPDQEEVRGGRHLSVKVGAAVIAVVLVAAGFAMYQKLRMPAAPRIVQNEADVPLVASTEALRAAGAKSRAQAEMVSNASTGPDARVGNPAPDPFGNDDARFRLASAFENGQGVNQDPVQAYALYVISAQSGNKASEAAIKRLTASMPQSRIAEVRFRLGQMHENGAGVVRDFSSAYFWFAVAEAAGHPRASSEKRKLEAVMSPGDVLRASERASAWLSARSAAR